MSVGLELSGWDVIRPFIDAAHAEHPSLLDAEHKMDALFGVVNIPNVVWVDEDGMIVRPAEPGWPEARQAMPPPPPSSDGKPPANPYASIPRMGRARTAPTPPPEQRFSQTEIIGSGQDRAKYVEALRDWAERGAASRYALSPNEVLARSQSRSPDKSAGAAHFELAQHLWHQGRRDLAIAHFNECHRLQPENWTYKRQAWSLIGHDRVGGDMGRFVQGPLEGEEEDWPFTSDFRSDTALLGPGEYYPNTFD